MAVIFELVVNLDADAVDRAVDRIAAAPPITVAGRRIGLHPPYVRDVPGFVEVAVVPVGVGWGLPADAGHPRVELDAAGLSALGRGLYDLLARLDGYQAAMIGWDPECYVDLDELRHEWAAELAGGELPGLVLSSDALAALGPASGFEPFTPGYRWIPYAGERTGSRR